MYILKWETVKEQLVSKHVLHFGIKKYIRGGITFPPKLYLVNSKPVYILTVSVQDMVAHKQNNTTCYKNHYTCSLPHFT